MTDGNVRRLRNRSEIARQGERTLGRLSDAARMAERVNPGRVVHVAIVTDRDGLACEIGADYNTVKVGPFCFERDRMPELWAALGESAWLAGTIEQRMHDEGVIPDGR